MADELKRKISNLERATEIIDGSLFMASVPDSSAESGYTSKAATVDVIAERMLGGVRYETELETTAKDIFGAINEAAKSGGGGSGVDEFARAEIATVKADLHEQSESLEALWKLNKGMTYDFLNKVERGLSVNPAGAFSKSLLDVRGESRQNSNKGDNFVPPFKDKVAFSVNISFDAENNLIVFEGIPTTSSSTIDIYSVGDKTSGFTPEDEHITIPKGTELKYNSTLIVTYLANDTFTTVTSITAVNRLLIDSDLIVYRLAVRIPFVAGESLTNIIAPYSGDTYEPYTGGVRIPNPDNPQEITPIEQINISIDGVVRTITPPFALNGLNINKSDLIDIERGVYSRFFAETTLASAKFSSSNLTSIPISYFPEIDTTNNNDLMSDKFVANATSISEYSMRLNNARSALLLYGPSGRTVTDIRILYPKVTPTETPIDSADLEYLRSLVNLDKDVSIYVTDQNGKDISYLLEYIIKLSEVN